MWHGAHRTFFKHRIQGCLIKIVHHDGQHVQAGQVIATIEGTLKHLLPYERILLNFLQRLSGIATLTHQWTEHLAKSSVRLLDTRKTLPGYRLLEKYATHTGGATNHRLGLYDMYMIKDTHLQQGETLKDVIHRLYNSPHKQALDVAVECHAIDSLRDLPYDQINHIMLDNMPLSVLKEAIQIIDGRAKIEVTGNIHLPDLSKLIACGIDYISTGTITHSARAMDISMKVS